jgi:hypothetical protein
LFLLINAKFLFVLLTTNLIFERNKKLTFSFISSKQRVVIMALQGDNSSSTDEEIQESSEKHKRRRVQ